MYIVLFPWLPLGGVVTEPWWPHYRASTKARAAVTIDHFHNDVSSLKYILEHRLPRCDVDLNLISLHCSQKTHEIVLYVHLRHNTCDVHFLL